MRERLTELVKQAHSDYLFNEGEVGVYEFIADRLIEAGAILPPVLVGQTVYEIDFRGLLRECRVSMITQKANGDFKVRLSRNRSVNDYTEDELNRYIFLTREAAEEALKAREKECLQTK